MSYARFLAFDLAGAVLWAGGFVWLGRAAGAVASGSNLVGMVALVGAVLAASALISVLARRYLGGPARLA
jgi:membrane protein DedA with SNARE-associated domain